MHIYVHASYKLSSTLIRFQQVQKTNPTHILVNLVCVTIVIIKTAQFMPVFDEKLLNFKPGVSIVLLSLWILWKMTKNTIFKRD